jgi:hypothetical protein
MAPMGASVIGNPCDTLRRDTESLIPAKVLLGRISLDSTLPVARSFSSLPALLLPTEPVVVGQSGFESLITPPSVVGNCLQQCRPRRLPLKLPLTTVVRQSPITIPLSIQKVRFKRPLSRLPRCLPFPVNALFPKDRMPTSHSYDPPQPPSPPPL